MKKIFTTLLLSVALVTMAQEVPTSFPRKFLIEHFTGDQCGYCPYGMYSIVEHIEKSSTPYVWVSHHYGFNNDEYTIPESEYIGKFIYPHDNVNTSLGAPNMVLNRTKIYGKTMQFHPAYLVEEGFDEIIKSKLDTTAEASVNINHTYNADTRELNITVSGQVANTAVTEYLLTVLIKENGLIGKQADYYWSWKTAGWKEFMHPCVLRGFISNHFGDNVAVENQAYSATYTFTMPNNWVAENCCVVAYITPVTKKPIINAEQVAIVEGTTGGEHFYPLGITSNMAPTNPDKITFDSIIVNKKEADKLEVLLISNKLVSHAQYGDLQPVLALEINTTSDKLPVDTLDISASKEENTITVGSFDINTLTYSGSCYYYVDPVALKAGMVDLYFAWRLNKGKLAIDAQGNILTAGNFYNGKHFTMRYTAPINTALEDIILPKQQSVKYIQDGKLIIRNNGAKYDVVGKRL